ncbi:exodeoxyribonuclease VII small subunit [Escherichia coli]
MRVRHSLCRRKNEAPASFEALSELEQIVTRLESGDLPLEEALNEFERGVQLARQGQAKLQQAEQRVQILLSDNEDASLTPFTPDNE